VNWAWFGQKRVRRSEIRAEDFSRKGAKAQKKDFSIFFASAFAALRLCVKYSSSIPPNSLTLLEKRLHAFVRVFSLHQLV
jgi:hypothetical protein